VIERHDFNSTWWGSDVGIVRDPAFFEVAAERRAELLAPFAWVEHRAPLEGEATGAVHAAGFSQVDTQVRFKIGLARLEGTPSTERLDVRFADEGELAVRLEDLADFRHERFQHLPGITPSSLNRRYALWSEHLIARDPTACMEVVDGGVPQGWFLGRHTDGGLELTLAMLRRDARISGLLLYHRALLAFAQRGARVGFAGFSVSNTPVLNIYAALGARFLTPEGCWLWTRP
jgi:hypothetical protein